MVDSLTPEERSNRMALVRSKGTKPEMAVRRLVHSLRYRYRLHDRFIPGQPDLTFRSRRKVIFVHGCFWHRHGEGCALTRMPKSRLDFWRPKLEENARRDREKQAALRALGWDYLVIWECQLKDVDGLTNRVREYLG
jgi:DNA mismatch endonuclease (patch repair protein)